MNRSDSETVDVLSEHARMSDARIVELREVLDTRPNRTEVMLLLEPRPICRMSQSSWS